MTQHAEQLNINTQCHVHLNSGDVSVLIDLGEQQLPSIVHWGASLGQVSAAQATTLAKANVNHFTANNQDLPVRTDILGSLHAGWSGRPGLSGTRVGQNWSPKFTLTSASLNSTNERQICITDGLVSASAATLNIVAVDSHSNLELTVDIELTTQGVVRTRGTLRNTASEAYQVHEFGLILPLPTHAAEILDFAGHWGKERVPQRRELTIGTHMRENRKGRTGADAAYVLNVGEPGFDFANGELWGLHLGYSGNQRVWAEKLYDGNRAFGASEILAPGEIELARGETISTPWIYGIYGVGLDEQAHRLHSWLRGRPSHPKRARPVTLNVWEAVYFNHDETKLKQLADRAAELGVERYVLDDGWFGSRRDDTSGLGDWTVSPEVWPQGLNTLIDHVTSLGMEFGLWFEPEMVNIDSDVAREHPEWIMAPAGRLPTESRNQQVLNLAIDEAYAHVRDQMVAVLEAHNIAYIKWDHNRDLLEAGNQLTGKASVHAQTLAAYRLMAELKERFPELEIESCSSGGARVDLGVLEFTDRVWVSDDIDPFERQQMHRWTQQLIPAELMGSHVASGASHTTHRNHSLHYRAGTAFWGHMGIEWDLTQADPEDMKELRAWIEAHKAHRDLLHNGRLVRVDQFDSSLDIHGVVSQDKTEAIFAVVSLALADTDPVGKFRFTGLDESLDYEILDITPGFEASAEYQGRHPQSAHRELNMRLPGWWPVDGPVTLSGAGLSKAGVFSPWLNPESLRILHLRALPSKGSK
ncbi:alpha-galactosidase [Arthrobacter sp. NIO-1057]|uniref:alpha-galactosidase n=1 Tax=Arthrobacter sp. NIO-1057 TaxID=993071 RepID=UPI00071D48A9|nr:alpha-galactosidase [Arthrobacter sp. NIO-1057]KSU66184.1 alpha-galactosidase [Arthrobacter sp. NIO-1057]SCC34184.1 alpha-galactosidase [Arthrobacter sp. NIO-1057]